MTGKGSKQRTIPLHPAIVEALAAVSRTDDVYVFPGRRLGTPMAPATIWAWVRLVAEEAGLLPPVAPHVLRHCCLSTANDSTGDLRAVQVAATVATLFVGVAAGASSSSSDRDALDEVQRKLTAAETRADDMTRQAGTLSGDLDRAMRASSTLPPPTSVTTLPPTTRAPATTATTAAPATTPGPKTTFGGEGTYRVGADIAPGTYRTAGPRSTGSFSACYWERQSDLSGTFGAIIANDNLQGPGVVTIAASDKGFKTSACQTWSQV